MMRRHPFSGRVSRDVSRGLSMVELLVGTAVGLLIAAAAVGVLGAQHAEARRVQIEARLMQDLRSTADLVGRDLRRAGYWSAAASGVHGDDAVALANPHAAIAPMAAASDGATLSFSTAAGGDATTVDDSERFGFRLRAGAVEVQLGARNWQALSDPGTLVVTSFRVEPRVDEVSLAAFCERPCSSGSATCPPRQQVRSFTIALAGRSATDAQVTRSLLGTVRARNDVVVGACQS